MRQPTEQEKVKRQYIPPVPYGVDPEDYRKMIEYLNKEMMCLLIILKHSRGNEILEEQDRITNEVFEKLKLSTSIKTFLNLIKEYSK